MIQSIQFHALLPVMPEIVLACGAMVLLMLGVMVGERSAAVVNGLCVLAAAGGCGCCSRCQPGRCERSAAVFVVDDFAAFSSS